MRDYLVGLFEDDNPPVAVRPGVLAARWFLFVARMVNPNQAG